MVAYHTYPVWKRGMWAAIAAFALGLLAHSRLIRPWQMRRRPWKVLEVRPEHERTWALVLQANEHCGFSFQTGQHVWLTLGTTPFSLQQHPFTIASSDMRADRIELTINALGDFTPTIGSVRAGEHAFWEGPYGSSWFYESGDTPLVSLAGGVGITPFVSALRTMRARKMRRDFTLFHGASSLAKATFHDELIALAGELSGRYIPVLASAPAEWEGQRGYITGEVLSRHLNPDQIARSLFALCGPPAMLEFVRPQLLALGASRRQIQQEQFDMV